MQMEDTIITPRIVQPRPWRTALLLLLVLIGMGAAAYAGFEFGRRQVHVAENSPADHLSHLQERIAELEAQNADRLSQARAQPSPQSAEHPAEEEPAPTLTSDQSEPPGEQTQPSAEESNVASNTPEDTLTDTTEAASTTPKDDTDDDLQAQGHNNALEIQDFRLRPLGTSNAVRFSFAVAVVGGASGTVTGSIWIAIDGHSGGKSVRLRLNEASKDSADFVRMRFKQRQMVEGDFVLPEDFTPKKVVVEAKPLDEDKYKAAADSFDWNLSTD